MPVKYVLQLIRWKNLAFMLLILLLVKYVLFRFTDADTYLSPPYFALLAFSVLSLAAAGYILNDIYDTETDRINKPERLIVGEKIDKEDAYLLYNIFNVLGILTGFAIAFLIHKISFSLVFIITSILLYNYSNKFKNSYITGNIIVSFLAFLSIVSLGIFDLVPAADPSNRAGQLYVFTIVLGIGLFAFLLTFIREVIKDIEDIPGDLNVHAQTIPIRIGITKSKKLLTGIVLLTILLVISYAWYYLGGKWYASLYVSLFIVLPLTYFVIKLKKAKQKSDFTFLSTLLKLIMLSGILTVFLF